MFDNIKKWFNEKVKPLFHDKWPVRLIVSTIGAATFVGLVQKSVAFPLWTFFFWMGLTALAFYTVSKPK